VERATDTRFVAEQNRVRSEYRESDVRSRVQRLPRVRALDHGDTERRLLHSVGSSLDLFAIEVAAGDTGDVRALERVQAHVQPLQVALRFETSGGRNGAPGARQTQELFAEG